CARSESAWAIDLDVW
nr:immunoglobulin heavy chain junction region [Macaca mulatta]